MMRRWTALSLAVLLLLSTTSCAQQARVEGVPPVKSTQSPQLGPGIPLEETLPEHVGPTWEEGRTLDIELPGNYNGLELPIQGATGYTSVELPLWAAVEDAAAAAEAVEAWETAQAEAAQLAEEQAAQASPSLPPPTGTVPGVTAGMAAPSVSPSPAPEAGQTALPTESPAPADTSPALPSETPAPQETAPLSSASPAPEETSLPASSTLPEVPAVTETLPAETALPTETLPPEETEPPTLTDGALTLLPSGTPFTVLQEEGDWWQIAVEADYYADEEQTDLQHGELTGWVEHRYCLVNLPDVIPSILYDATNSYASLFVTCGKSIPGITGEAFYPGKTYNQRLGREEFMMPVLYAMAKKLCQVQRSALAEGNSLVLYEGYRPNALQTKVYYAMSDMVREDPEVRAAVADPPWQISWFISSGLSNHQRGYAVDMSLAKVSEVAEYTVSGYRCLQVTGYELYEMPTPIHELSRAAATFTAPVNSLSPSAWKEAELSPSMNAPALGLQRYCTQSGLTPLSSEWWHFNDLDARSQILEHQGIGDFLISSIRSVAPG